MSVSRWRHLSNMVWYLPSENRMTLKVVWMMFASQPKRLKRHNSHQTTPCYTSARLASGFLISFTPSISRSSAITMCSRIVVHFTGCGCKHVERTIVCRDHAAVLQKRKTRPRPVSVCQDLDIKTLPLLDRNERICKECCDELTAAVTLMIKTWYENNAY
nr:hypothetical protein CFP56_44248 [Quercus suber]